MENHYINYLFGRSAQLDFSPVNIHNTGLYQVAPLCWYISRL